MIRLNLWISGKEKGGDKSVCHLTRKQIKPQILSGGRNVCLEMLFFFVNCAQETLLSSVFLIVTSLYQDPKHAALLQHNDMRVC